MATLIAEAPPPTRPFEPDPGRPEPDVWPQTSRPMPWLLAVFMFMVYMIPFDSTLLPIKLPFNSGLDRMVLIVIGIVWLAVSVTGTRRPRFCHTPINLMMYLFVALSCLSLIINLRDLVWDRELSLGFKQMLLAFTYLLFFYMASSSIRREDVRNFCKLLVFLGVASALGTILEYRSHTNIFADLAHLIPGAKVHAKSAVGIHHATYARRSVGGPTKHGLADATMLDAALPFAIAFMTRATKAADKFWWGLAAIVLIAGCVATQEKTAFILLVVSLAVIVAYRPRRYARLWPLLIVAIILTRIAAPHSISALKYQFTALGSSNSTSGRTADYSAVAPFLNSHLLFGRGFGSYDPHKYRILDDQMLGFLIEIGAFGLLAYTGMIMAPVYATLRRARRGLTIDDDLLAGISAGCVAFFVSNFLYDSFDFRQGPYVFFFLAALAAAAVGRRGSQAVAPEAAPATARPPGQQNGAAPVGVT